MQDYSFQYRHSIRSQSDLAAKVDLTESETKFFAEQKSLPFLVTPYYAGLIDPKDPEDPIRKMVVPQAEEANHYPEEYVDPLGEEKLSPVPGIVHRYPDRVLFLLTAFCSTYCRYCTRSRMVGNFEEYSFPKKKWQQGLDYIRAHKEVKDVLLSGGDPLTLPNKDLAWLLDELASIEHVRIKRLGTKIPTVLPQRIDQELCNIFAKHKPFWLSLHLSHPREYTVIFKEKIAMLLDAGVQMQSQTVLLKGVNDNVETLKDLFYGMIEMGIRPYYLLHCDLVKGSRHLRIPLTKSIELYQQLSGHISGYAVPKLVVDLPGGKGKIPINPNKIADLGNGQYSFTNYLGEHIEYNDGLG
jgi:lysine 2,3-aminomutase